MEKTFLEAIASTFKKSKYLKNFIVLFPNISLRPNLSIKVDQNGEYTDGGYNILFFLDEKLVETGFWGDLSKTSEKYYRNGLKNGPAREWHEDGTLAQEGHYENGLLEGIVTEWYEIGGKKSEAMFHSGQLDGRYMEWYPNGQPMEDGDYRADQKVGYWEYWNEDGELYESFEGD